MNEQQATAIGFPCLKAEDCVDPIYRRVVPFSEDRCMSVMVTVNVGEE